MSLIYKDTIKEHKPDTFCKRIGLTPSVFLPRLRNTFTAIITFPVRILICHLKDEVLSKQIPSHLVKGRVQFSETDIVPHVTEGMTFGP